VLLSFRLMVVRLTTMHALPTVAVGVRVRVGGTVAVKVAVGVFVRVTDGVTVAVLVGVTDGVAVAVAVARNKQQQTMNKQTRIRRCLIVFSSVVAKIQTNNSCQ